MTTYSIHFLDAVVMCDYQVCKLGQELLGRRLANKKPDMVEGVCSPGDKDQKTDEDGTDRVNIPDDTATNNGHGKTEGIDDNIVAVINEEDMDRRVATENKAVGTQRTLGEDYTNQYAAKD